MAVQRLADRSSAAAVLAQLPIWFNDHRFLEPIGYVPPAEHEEAYYRRQEGSS